MRSQRGMSRRYFSGAYCAKIAHGTTERRFRISPGEREFTFVRQLREVIPFESAKRFLKGRMPGEV
jgi:hypothetical protein